MIASLYKSKVIENKKINQKFNLVTLRALSDDFIHLPGQFVNLKINKNTYRAYSIASHPSTLPIWKMFVDITPGGPGTTYISKLSVGDTVDTTIPNGNFILKKNKNVSILTSTGCGIAPLASMISDLLKKSDTKVYLIWGLRSEEDVINLESLIPEINNSNLKYTLVLSKPSRAWNGKRGHVESELIELCKKEKSNKPNVYISGNGGLIVDSLKELNQINFPENYINFEQCYFTPSR